MLTIYGAPKSRTFRCLWAAEEAGLAYENIPLGFGPELRTAEFRAINPNGRIPVLRDGSLTLFESLAINLHLAAKAGPPLMPEGDDAARTLQWTLWAATEVETPAIHWALHAAIHPPAQRDPALAASARATLDQRLAVLEAHLADRPFLLGEEFTIADCNLAGVLYVSWFSGYDYAACPRVRAWLERCLSRPAALVARKRREK